ncbi:DUF1461 domain-containing protein [Galactobacter caseinivorans]|uniref:DUF1461 domain-containing protein n=1 Tax=Galactobacter caseinivorans TaxID=2676123 RepID=A0A496PJJ0_9MICC|nr:DUF1461 domain-containing protein [Galactobacter caseinivorans]RKW70639.1 DUF1461 domain-containing protein [Galactobacter caseinivorans]
MSQNQTPQPPNGGQEPEWWEAGEYAGQSYVPGSLDSDTPADTGSAAATDSAATDSGAANSGAGESSAARAARLEASGPPTEAVPVVVPVVVPGDAPGASAKPVEDEPAQEPVLRHRPIAEPMTAPFAATSTASAQRTTQTAAQPITPQSTTQASPATAALREAAPEPETTRYKDTEGLDVPGVTSETTLKAALETKPVFPRVLQWVVAILTPLVLVVLAIRSVASGGFLWLEYNRPGFPQDQFGFNGEQRMTFGSYGLNFINSFAGRDYLGGLMTPNGVQTTGGVKLFRDEEVGHMADVQALVHLAYLLGVIAVVIIAISFLVLRSRYAGGIRRGLFAGAWVTLGLFAALGAMAVLGWQTFFTGFHELFFTGGNWEFFMDDTLIRLYPPQFWMDAALTLAGIVAVAVLLILIFTWPTRARRERSKLRQAEREFRLS